MLFRVLIVGLAILVAIPERWIAPALTAEVDRRSFCERNAKTCGAPREILVELSRKTRLLIARLREAKGETQSVTALPGSFRLTQSATDPAGTMAQQTLTTEDRAVPWRAPTAKPDQ
jgi:hypothetical protein